MYVGQYLFTQKILKSNNVMNNSGIHRGLLNDVIIESGRPQKAAIHNHLK